MPAVKLFSLKRLLWSVPLSILLFLVAGYVGFGTGLYENGAWTLREILGALLLPAAFLPGRFEETRAGFIMPDQLAVILPLHLLYTYILLTALAAVSDRYALAGKIRRLFRGGRA